MTSSIAFPASPSTDAGESTDRPTTPTVRGIVTDAVSGVDADLARRAEGTKNWREGYLRIIRDLTEVSATSPEAAVAIARAGLASAHERMVAEETDGASVPLSQWDIAAAVAEARGRFGTRAVHGQAERVDHLAIPYRGRDLVGHDLERQLDAWVTKGVIEPSCAEAVKKVINHPEWLALPGHIVASLGAGAEMGPLEMLCRWGATVLAVDIPRATERLEKFAAAGSGTVLLPVGEDGSVGADMVADPAGIAAWINDNAGDADLVLGMHAYADSGMHVRLTLAADVIGQHLRRIRPTLALAFLATPTDAFVVPPEVVAAAKQGWNGRGRRGAVENLVSKVSRGALFTEPYPKTPTGRPGVADCLIAQQGPNYAVAKRLQRWRAVAAEADGQRVSFNVAPATLTRSVTKNPVLRAVYGGAHHFDVEVFEPATSRALMAALLVHDIMREDLATGAGVPRVHGEELFSDNAAHGGLWRVSWAPRSALSVAAVVGAPRLLKR